MKTNFVLSVLTAVAAVSAGLLRAGDARTAPERRTVNYDAPASNYLPLRRVQSSPVAGGESTVGSRSLDFRGVPPLGKGYTELRNMNSVYYVVDIVVGNDTVAVLIDTGSSDTWLIHKSFQCVTMNERPRPQAQCGFGPAYNGDFSEGGEQFGRMYGDSTFVVGRFGYESVTIGGITVPHQQLAMVNYTFWYGDGKSSGLLGLAYPFLTGLDENAAEYPPLFTSMWQQGLSKAEFSIALTRQHVGAPEDAEGSYLAFGGVPPVTYDEESWAKTPLLKMKTLKEYWWLEEDQEGFYIIQPEAMVYGNGTSTTRAGQSDALVNETTGLLPLVVDVGSTFTILPTTLVERIFEHFEDPPIWVGSGASYYARCDQKPPAFGIKLGGKTFFMSPADMLRQEQRDHETGELCRVGLYDRGVGPYTLGVSFLTNVVAVFDVGNTEMRFAAREKY